jgi:Tfp pilus assembly protein PilO
VKAKFAALDLKIQLAGVLIVVGLLAFLGHMFIVSPQSASATQIQGQIDDEQTQIYHRRAVLKSGLHPPTIQTADLFRLARAMPDREDMPGIILTLSQVAQSAGIKFDLIEPVLDPVPSAGSYNTRRIHLKFNGDFYGLSDFLFRLRSLVAVRDGKLLADGRLFNVDTLTFKMQENNFPKISAELFVQAYVYSGATGAAAAPTTTPLTTPAAGTSTSSSTTPSGPPPTTPPTTSATALGAS